MTPIFVQTDRHIIDVAKIAYTKTLPGASFEIHFCGIAPIIFDYAEMDSLLNAIAELSRKGFLIASVAKGAE